MSLLIKALEKAEEVKKTDGTLAGSSSNFASELVLEPINQASASAATAAPDPVAEAKLNSQQTASTVFTAKTPPPANNKALIAIGAALALLLLIGGGLYFYLQTLNSPQLSIPPNAQVTTPKPLPASPAPIPVAEQAAVNAAPIAEQNILETTQPETVAVPEPASNMAPEPVVVAEKTETISEAPTPPEKAVSASKKSRRMDFGQTSELGNNSTLKVTRNKPESGVLPDLQAAYQAFSLGDDTKAQKLYWEVLRSDSRNTDALLGLAAIASRQGRVNDAAGWYGKVLEIEPRNSYAQTAMLELRAQADPLASESSIKTMLATQPQSAHLHAALGNLYLERADWSNAQQAFFEAHQYAPHQADYAYNLAVCLDQMGKGNLALPYYKKTLQLMQSNNSGNIDRESLQTRISALELQQ